MDTVINFNDDIFKEYPGRFNLYFKAPCLILRVMMLIDKGWNIKAVYSSDTLDIYDWVRVYVTAPPERGSTKYLYMLENGVAKSEHDMMLFLDAIEENK